ncbi:MAG: hypothetical protein Greene041662_205 [Candidatus Peregrinibacteria bacterium Greene0416_62]|nr:MAG: hypothetical protein Greene041662_205 [Candidatus Peregrinibacteria bacterium Greene0416_62]
MAVSVTTTKEGVAVVGTVAGKRETCVIDAFGVFIAVDFLRAFVGTGARGIDALASGTGKMCPVVAAAKEGIAFILTVTGDSDAGIILASCMLATGNGLRAFIGTIPCNENALATFTGKMFTIITATKHGITVILGITGNSHALIALAFGVLVAADFR